MYKLYLLPFRYTLTKKFHPNPFMRFGATGGGVKFSHSDYFVYWLLQQLYTSSDINNALIKILMASSLLLD